MAKNRKGVRKSRGHTFSEGAKTLRSGTITLPPGTIPSPSQGKSAALDFTHALMQGHPAAVQAAQRALGDNPKDEPSLADQFLASTYEWAKLFNYTAHDAKQVEPILLSYRQAMRQANRFVLDNDFTRYATEVSNRCTPEKVLYRLQFATLPYRTTWIEFDLHVKVRAMRAFHGLDPTPPDGVEKRMGLLLERAPGVLGDRMATVTLLGGGWDNHRIVTPNLSGYIFTLDERALTFDRVINGLTPFDAAYRMDRLRNMPQFADVTGEEGQQTLDRVVNGSMWGFAETGQTTWVSDAKDMLKYTRVPSLLRHHGQIAFTRFYDFFERVGKDFQPTTTQLITDEITEFTGMMRWIVCVLAMLNEVPTRSDLIKPMHTMRAGLVRRVAAMDYHRVTLKLPKTKPVPWIERHLSNVERKHKAHEVRSHWRTYINERACPREDHQWEYDYEHGYRLCGRCESFSRLIHEHIRGDISLGWVKKDYIIKTNPGG